MRAEEYLEMIPVLSRRVETNRKALARMRESLDITGISYESIGAASGTRKTDEVGELVGKVVDFENELMEEELKLARMTINATSAISKLVSVQEKEILTRWYLNFESLEKIMEETSYSRSRVYAIRSAGLKNIPDFESQY